ncbi:hypothetical protein PTSG_00719 [Salpingoeca rosetta]|uniref:Nucleolar 27S pre-rRNA processing Urb2/Npa2 C-terminal domain-containing protein n=1 Tax=Salpingoeca rosetta (strain ATCC 50818 / BSB-021) TaxID=946362 RepID=F2TXA2_SALR5|nr:uncharacterized protein PTSG_00719 [Salpingoeca rosetta]EGD76011.1 hypothetical protein PTSG_00719 [Salpingoeca rosetta]|eukprot:XP_004998186.1 hypothetical protein PTSG_00719 [Salpingoeca rosetta]
MASAWECVVNASEPLAARVNAAQELLTNDVPLPRKHFLLWKWANDVVFTEKHAEVVDIVAYWQLIQDLLVQANPDTATLIIPRQFLQVITTVGKRLTAEDMAVADVETWLALVGSCFTQITQLQEPRPEDLNKCLGVFLQTCAMLCQQQHQQLQQARDIGHTLALTVEHIVSPCLSVYAGQHKQHMNARKNFTMLCQKWLPTLLLLHQQFEHVRAPVEEVLSLNLFSSEHIPFFAQACEDPFPFDLGKGGGTTATTATTTTNNNNSSNNTNSNNNTGSAATDAGTLTSSSSSSANKNAASTSGTPHTKRPKLGQRADTYPRALFDTLRQLLATSEAEGDVMAGAALHGMVTLMTVIARRVRSIIAPLSDGDDTSSTAKPTSTPASTNSGGMASTSATGATQQKINKNPRGTVEEVMAYNVMREFVAILMAAQTRSAAATAATIGALFRVFAEHRVYMETFDAVHDRVVTKWAASVAKSLVTALHAPQQLTQAPTAAATTTSHGSTAGSIPASIQHTAPGVEATAKCLHDMASCCYLFVEEHLEAIWLQLLPRTWLLSPASDPAASAVLAFTRYILSLYAKLRQLDAPAKALATACVHLVSHARSTHTLTATMEGAGWHDARAVSSLFLRELAQAWAAATNMLPAGQSTHILTTVAVAFEPAWEHIRTARERDHADENGHSKGKKTPKKKAKGKKTDSAGEAGDGSGDMQPGAVWGAHVVCATTLWLAMMSGLLTSSVVEMRATAGLCAGMEAVHQHCMQHLQDLPPSHPASGLLLMVQVRLTLYITDLCIVLLRGMDCLPTISHSAPAGDGDHPSSSSSSAPSPAEPKHKQLLWSTGKTSRRTAPLVARVTELLAALPSVDSLHATYDSLQHNELATRTLLGMTAFLIRQSTLPNLQHAPDLVPQRSRKGKHARGNGGSAQKGKKRTEEDTNAMQLGDDVVGTGAGQEATNDGEAAHGGSGEALRVRVHQTNKHLIHTLLAFNHPSKWLDVVALFPLIWEWMGRPSDSYAVTTDADAVATTATDATPPPAPTTPATASASAAAATSTLTAAQLRFCQTIVDALWRDVAAADGVLALLSSPAFVNTADAHPAIAGRLLRCITAALGANVDHDDPNMAAVIGWNDDASAGHADTATTTTTAAGSAIATDTAVPAVCFGDGIEHAGSTSLLELCQALQRLPWLHSRHLCTPVLLQATLPLIGQCLALAAVPEYAEQCAHITVTACTLLQAVGQMIRGLAFKLGGSNLTASPAGQDSNGDTVGTATAADSTAAAIPTAGVSCGVVAEQGQALLAMVGETHALVLHTVDLCTATMASGDEGEGGDALAALADSDSALTVCMDLLASFIGNELLARVHMTAPAASLAAAPGSSGGAGGAGTDGGATASSGKSGKSTRRKSKGSSSAKDEPSASAAAASVDGANLLIPLMQAAHAAVSSETPLQGVFTLSLIERFPALVKDAIVTLTDSQCTTLCTHLLAATPAMAQLAAAVGVDSPDNHAGVVLVVDTVLRALSAVVPLLDAAHAPRAAGKDVCIAIFTQAFQAFKLYLFTDEESRSPVLSQLTEDALGSLASARRGLPHLPLSSFERMYAAVVRVALQARHRHDKSVSDAALSCITEITPRFSEQQLPSVLDFVASVLGAAATAVDDTSQLHECALAIHQYRTLITCTNNNAAALRLMRRAHGHTFRHLLRIVEASSQELFVCTTPEDTLERHVLHTDVICACYRTVVALLRSDHRKLSDTLANAILPAIAMVSLPSGPDRHQAAWAYNLPTLFASGMQLVETLDPVVFELLTRQRRVVSTQMPSFVGIVARTCASFLYWSSCISQVTVDAHVGVLRQLNNEYKWVDVDEAQAADDTTFLTRVRQSLVTRATQTAGKLARSFEDLATSKATLGKFAPYLLSACLVPLSNLMLPSSTRTAFFTGMYPLVDMCTSYDRDLVHAATPPEARPLFKRLYDDYKRFHMYRGQF